MKYYTFEQQVSYARQIKDVKQKEWLEFTKQYVPQFVAELLFYPRGSVINEMLLIDPQYGYLYDPATIIAGVDNLLNILKNKQSSTIPRLERMYQSFEDPKTRIDYLRTFIDQLDLYPLIGRAVIEDLKTIAPTLTDPEEIEINQNRIHHIQSLLRRHEEEENKNKNKNFRYF